MTKTLAIEWALKDIRINSIQPGIIASSGMRNYPHGVAIAEQTRPEIPMKRLGTCEEVAQLALFLASDAAKYITGQVWAIDGGRSLWGEAMATAQSQRDGTSHNTIMAMGTSRRELSIFAL